MKNNLRLFRDAAGLQMSDISKLLNIRVDRYRQYEKGNMLMPNAILIMVSKIYNIPICFLFCSSSDIDDNTIEYLNGISKLDHSNKILVLVKNLTGAELAKLSYHQIAKIINGIEDMLNNLNMYL
jgi:transcriptional regulator with XRE-family HTH domain